MKTLIAVGTLALASLSMAYGRSYEVAFATPVQVGNTTLGSGAYFVAQKGNDAVFTNVENDHTYTVPATINHLNQKNSEMNVVITNQNGVHRLQSIGVGGRAMGLSFPR